MRWDSRATFLVPCALAALLVGCDAGARYRVLSVFFDGVPAPGQVSKGPDAKQAAKERRPAGPVETEAPVPVVFLHKPYAEGKCVSCHSATQANRVDATSALCFRCHKDDKTKGEVVHVPVAGGDCGACHHPHESSFKYQLTTEPPALCLTCHDKADLGKAKPHALAGDRACTVCHDPHSSDFPALLISRSGGKVCFNCHEASAVIAPDRLTHFPAKEGLCMSCHVSHTKGGKSHLAREGAALCGECHEIPAKGAKVVHLPVAAGDCVGCHNPHGSKVAANLTQPVPKLCASCHDDAGHVKDMIADNAMCTECHSPHGSTEAKLLK